MELYPDISYEYDYVRVVYELIVSKLRFNKKIIEKELSLITAKLSQLKKKLITEKIISIEIENSFDTMIKRIILLQNKHNTIIQEENSLYHYLQERLNTLKYIDKDSNEDYKSNALSNLKFFLDKKLNNLILDFLLKQRYIETASNFIEEENIKDSIELVLYQEYQKIVESMKQKSVVEALNWCNQNKNKLQKSNYNVKFKLLKQQFLEMYKKNENIANNMQTLLSCISFAKENFTQDDITEHIDQIRELMSIVSINQRYHKELKTIDTLLSDNKWDELCEEFKQVYFSSYNVKINSSLEFYFYCGLISLKTAFCYKQNLSDSCCYNSLCPICNKEIGELAENLPLSQHANTSLLCRKNNCVMDFNNPPLSTKDGYLYSTEYVKNKSNGLLKCIKTNKTYSIDELRKVFIV